MELLKNLEGLSADEQMTAVVELQKAAMKHLEEQKQASIGKSAELVIQGLKKIKSDFEAKFDSLNYDIQTKVASLKDGEQGLQGPKGDQGERGLDGANGRDGRDGKDGKDGLDGVDGVGVRDAKIDFDGSLVISLTDGREINCGEVVSVDVAKQIQKVTHNIQTGAGGDSQTVLDAIAALQATIATYGTMATQNANNVAITGGAINNTTIGATTPSTGVFTTLTAQNETLKGTGQNLFIYSQPLNVGWNKSGTATLADNSTTAPDGTATAALLASPVGSDYIYQTPATVVGVGYTLSFYIKNSTATASFVQIRTSSTAIAVNIAWSSGVPTPTVTAGSGSVTSTSVGSGWYRIAIVYVAGEASARQRIYGGDGTSVAGNVFLWGVQLEIGSTANTYIPTTTTAVYGTPTLSFSGVASLGLQSDGSLYETSAGTGNVRFYTNNIAQEQMRVSHTASAVNYVQVTGGATGSGPTISAQGSDANPNLNIVGKGTGAVLVTTNGRNSFSVEGGTSAASNFISVINGATGVAPQIKVSGFSTDTNADLTLTTKGTGAVNLNTGSNVQLKVTEAGVTNTSWTEVQGGISATKIYANGSGSNIEFRASSKGTSAVALYTNAQSQLQLNVAHTASAVNYLQVQGNATGGAPTISAQGSDANVYLDLKSKGNLQISLYTGGGIQFAALHTASAVNYATAKGSATGFGVVFGATGTDTNIPLVLQPKGTGALQAQQTDSTATGGNARGANAVDWQTVRSAASQVASNQGSVIVGGRTNTSSGQDSFIGAGYGNTSSSAQSVVVGGAGNIGSGQFTFIGGGTDNRTNGQSFGAVVAGFSNTAAGYYNFVGGGAVNSATSSSAVTTQSATMNATTAVTLSGSNANIKVGQLVTGTYLGFPVYVTAVSGTSLTISTVATGSGTSTLSFYTPHGVVVGGGNNQATGAYSFIGGGGDAGTAAGRNISSGDWAFVGGGRANTASAIGSIVVGGGFSDTTVFAGNTASGIGSLVVGGIGNASTGVTSSIVGGEYHLANGNRSFVAGGAWGTTRGIVGNHVFSASNNPMQLAVLGTQQTALLVLARQTTDATPTVLCSTGASPSGVNQVILPNNSAYAFRGEIVSGVTGGGNSKSWTIEGLIKRGANAASTTLVGSTVTSMYADAGAVTWTIALSADTTNGGLAVTFTGQAATTIRTVAQIRTTEMTY